MSEREDLFDGVGFEGGGSGIKECVIGCQRPGGLQRWERGLDVVSYGVGDGWDHFGVEHESCC